MAQEFSTSQAKMKLSRYRHGYFFLIFKVRSTYAVCLGDFANTVTIDSGAGING